MPILLHDSISPMPILLLFLAIITFLAYTVCTGCCRSRVQKGEKHMYHHVENVTLLYLMNQDTESLSLDELYNLYRETLKHVQESEERYKDSHKQDVFSFDQPSV